MPENPKAWLYTVAKNKARNYFQRHKIFLEKVSNEISHSTSDTVAMEIDLSDQNIFDSQLKMLFAICHPAISADAQIGLALRVLCGFGIEEIATAFLTNKEVINKRLHRAKETLRLKKVPVELPSETEIHKRLENVLKTLYLLYNEGYYSESQDVILREDLCREAMRLTHMLVENTATSRPAVYALLSLMYFHASRFAARKDTNGEIVLYHDQDETRWDYEMIAKGAWYMKEASQGNTFTTYHLEAGIAYWHTIKEDTKEKWENILQLYNHLLQITYSPIAALNRTYALSKATTNLQAIAEAEKLQLTNNHYYYTLLGELYKDIDGIKSQHNFKRALSLARTEADKRIISRNIEPR